MNNVRGIIDRADLAPWKRERKTKQRLRELTLKENDRKKKKIWI